MDALALQLTAAVYLAAGLLAGSAWASSHVGLSRLAVAALAVGVTGFAAFRTAAAASPEVTVYRGPG